MKYPLSIRLRRRWESWLHEYRRRFARPISLKEAIRQGTKRDGSITIRWKKIIVDDSVLSLPYGTRLHLRSCDLHGEFTTPPRICLVMAHCWWYGKGVPS